MCQFDTIPPERLSEWLLYQFPDGILLGLRLGFVLCVCGQGGKNYLLVVVVTELFCPDELCPSSRQIAEPSTAFLDGNAVLLHEPVREIFKARCNIENIRNLFPQSVLHGFKLLLLGRLSSCGEGCVLTVKFQLTTPTRPILGFAHTLLRAVEQVDLVQSGTLAQFHDLDTQVPHGLGCAGVLHTLAPVAGLLHIGLAFHLACSDAADYDVDVNVSRMVVPIRVSADDGRVTGEVFFAEFQAKCLCLFHGQPVVGCISWVKADDILVAFDITMLGVLAILAVCQQTGRCKREITALKGVEQVGFPQHGSALFIQKLLSGELIVLVNEVRFDGGVVRVFITIRLFKSLATTSNCMSQICGLWLNNATALATEAICLSVAIQFTQNFLGMEPECSQVCKFVKEFRSDLLGVCTA